MAVKKKEKKKRGAPGWMVSWADMTTLLLVFFIIMMGVTDVVERDLFLVLSSFKGTLGIMGGGQTISPGELEHMGYNVLALPTRERERSLAKSVDEAISVFKPEIESKKVRVFEDERGLVISLSGDAYFDPGSAVIKDELRPVLGRAGDILNVLDNFVRIEGHTDGTPVTLARDERGYPTNWELSGARATNVLRFLAEQEDVYEKRLSAVAFGEQRPIDDDTTIEGRAFNRRVDIIIVRDKRYEPSRVRGIERPLPQEEWR